MRNFINRILRYRPDLLIVLIVLAVVVVLVSRPRVRRCHGVGRHRHCAATFLYGARLSIREALNGLTHWRLHLLILVHLVVFPLIGLARR